MEYEMINGSSATLVVVVLGLMSAFKNLFEDFFHTALGQRLLPIIPIILGILGGLLDLAETAPDLKSKLLAGLFSGISAAMLFKIGKTTVMGKGIESQSMPTVEKTPQIGVEDKKE